MQNGRDDAMADPSDEFSEFRQDVLGGAARLHFPVNKADQHGGKALLKKWADVLRQLASDLDAIGAHQGLDEHTALFLSKGAVRKANAKINAYRDRRQSAFR